MDDRHNHYKDMLLDLSQKINKDDLQRMKFKCDQIIKKRQNEKITIPTDLFTALEERGYLGESNLSYLKDLLKTCCGGKIDGLRVLDAYERVFIPGQQNVEQLLETSRGKYIPGIPQHLSQPQVVYVVQNGNTPSGAPTVQREYQVCLIHSFY